MHLRAEQYQQIITQLRSEQRQMKVSERRVSPRVGFRTQVRVIPCPTNVEPTMITAWARDLSVDGIGLLFPESISPGTYMILTLPAGPGKTLDLLYLVMWCQPLGVDQFSVGAKFNRVITPDDIK